MEGLNSKIQQPILSKSDALNNTRAYLNPSVLAKLLPGYINFLAGPAVDCKSLLSTMSSSEANQLKDVVVSNSGCLLLSDFTNKALVFFCATKFDK